MDVCSLHTTPANQFESGGHDVLTFVNSQAISISQLYPFALEQVSSHAACEASWFRDEIPSLP